MKIYVGNTASEWVTFLGKRYASEDTNFGS